MNSIFRSANPVLLTEQFQSFNFFEDVGLRRQTIDDLTYQLQERRQMCEHRYRQAKQGKLPGAVEQGAFQLSSSSYLT